MSKQPEALLLADYIDDPLMDANDVAYAAATELRRLHALVQEWESKAAPELSQPQPEIKALEQECRESAAELRRLHAENKALRAERDALRKPLTDEQLCDLWSWSMTADAERTANTQQHAFARAIEAAHGIKEGKV